MRPVRCSIMSPWPFSTHSSTTPTVCREAHTIALWTGLIPDAYYTASKIRFILDAVPGAQERAERGELLAGTVDTWLIWNLTGRKAFVTEYSNASRTMMFNLETREWDDDLLSAYGIPRRMLAEIVASDAVVGDIGATFGAEIPIASNLGDQQAGLFGQAAFAPGQSKMPYGPAGVLATGVFADLDAVKAMWKQDRRFEPTMSRDQADSLYAGWRTARDLTRGWARNVPLAH